MNKLNYEILQGIDEIADAELESGMKVLESMIAAYEKADMILENSSENVDLSAYDIFQESVLFQEAEDSDKSDKSEDKNKKSDDKSETGFRRINKKTGKKESIIKSILLAIPRAIMMFVKFLKNKFGNSKMKQMQKDMERLQQIIDAQGGTLKILKLDNGSIGAEINANERRRYVDMTRQIEENNKIINNLNEIRMEIQSNRDANADNAKNIEKLGKRVTTNERDIAAAKQNLSKIERTTEDIVKLQVAQLIKDGNLFIPYDPEQLVESLNELIDKIEVLCEKPDILKAIKSSNFDDFYGKIRQNAERLGADFQIISIRDFTDFINKTCVLAEKLSKVTDTFGNKTKAAMKQVVEQGKLNEHDESLLKKKMRTITGSMPILSAYFDRNYNFYFAGWMTAHGIGQLRESTDYVGRKIDHKLWLDAQVDRKYYEKQK